MATLDEFEKVLIIDVANGTQIIRDLTNEEIAELEAQRAEAAAQQAAIEAKAAARQSALDKLAALGLTADEIAAL